MTAPVLTTAEIEPQSGAMLFSRSHPDKKELYRRKVMAKPGVS